MIITFTKTFLPGLSLLAFLAMPGQTFADLLLNDGATHVINTGDYQDEFIRVSNGTTVEFQEGAILRDGQVDLFDTSEAVISGGDFGGTGPGVVYGTGWVVAHDNASVVISGGNFGKRVDDTGGTFLSGCVEGLGNSRILILGGQFGGSTLASGRLAALENSEMTISGGTFGGSGDTAGEIDSDGSARIYIYGGTHGAYHVSYASSKMLVYGGVLTTSGGFTVYQGSVITFYGQDFQRLNDGSPQHRGPGYGVVMDEPEFQLNGTLADGFTFERLNCSVGLDGDRGKLFLLPAH